ncbi:eukaryotic translation initiation factor 3 subunit L [Hyalella azteca]|uniref:Eukaryotic translation initiation factor 3 subunit L n=1 Tax=Hyalella azteca TaxID=294128 RepID=A0A8B7NZH0_HYAAZ|nr:eukaryotic translation initiation factor 3 subunit L [Hyalella azteca]
MYNEFVDEFENYPEDYQYDRGLSVPEEGSSITYSIPEDVKKYILYFRDIIRDGSAYEIPVLYSEFGRLTELYYMNQSWPELSDLYANKLIEEKEDETFLILYQELFYRHIYAQVPGGPTLEHRFESYFNYCKFFNFILSAETPIKLELPNQWLWEIIDEFIYQFQAFSQFRSKLQKKTESELELLRENPKIWNVHSVLNVLHCVIDKSNINQQLEVYTSGGDPDTVAGEFGRHSLYKMLGYFSLVGLLRLHSLLGDYYQALKVLENIELNKKSMYSRVAACQITTYYYVGFAYMMMRRYADAIRTFSNILVYIQRTRTMFQSRTYQNDQINKQTEQMYTLLAICLVLHPQRIDEAIQSTLREKALAEKIARMTRGDINEFSNCFTYACPKFLSPVPPAADAVPADYHKEPLQQQLKVFLDEVQQQMQISVMRSYLKLYTTMPVEKAAAFTGMSNQDFCNSLLCFKHKMMNVVWTKGTSGLNGDFQSDSEVDFYIDKQMIHIADTKVAQRYGDFFIRQIHKLEEVSRGLAKVKI